MDIFTTVLRKVVSAPIKPKKLKVKALVKEAETGKLTKDPNHLENHDYYFSLSDDAQASQENPQENKNPPKNTCETLEQPDNSEDGGKKEINLTHLDIYI
jgi:hypothetical protein